MTNSLSRDPELDPPPDQPGAVSDDQPPRPLISAPQAELATDGDEQSGDADDELAEVMKREEPSGGRPAFGADDTSPIDADELLDSLLGDDAIDPNTEETASSGDRYQPTDLELRQMPPPVVDPAPPTGTGRATPPESLATRATTPEVGRLELRQIAGLTSGSAMPLEPQCYDFAQDDGVVGFQLQVDHNDRVVVIPHGTQTKIDSVEVDRPTVVGLGVLDVGSARFLTRHQRVHKRATDWLELHDAADSAEPLIEVPLGLADDAALGTAKSDGSNTKKRRPRLRGRRRTRDAEVSAPTLDGASFEFIDRIRSVRIELTDRERYLHPDPAELADRARQRAPILAIRPPGHPLFGKVSVIAADMPWMPHFDDISAIPHELGAHLKPLMSLPSQPITADLMVGPLGIVGNRSARMACARHVMTSLYGLSTPDLRLHLARPAERQHFWDWCHEMTAPEPVDTTSGFPVVVVDGMETLAASGMAHADAIEHRAGAVFLADNVEDLPSYCGTVLQVDGAGSGLLTNNLGNIIAGTPIGITTAFATEMAGDLVALMNRRHQR